MKTQKVYFQLGELQSKDGEPPSEFKILSAGLNKTKKGPFLFDEKAAESVLREYADHGAELHVDYNHDFGKAAAWFKPEVRNGELWASDVQWTPHAADALKSREYRYFSPALMQDVSSKRVTRIINVALTNTPAMSGLKPLVAEEDTDMKPNHEEGASEAQAKAPEQHFVLALSERDALFTQLKVKTLAEAIGRVAAFEENTRLLSETQGKLAALELENKKAAAEVLLSEAEADGRITPAERTVLASQDVAFLKGYLAVKTKAPAVTSVTPPVTPEGQVNLSAADLDVIRLSGISKEEFIKQRKVELASSQAGG